MNKVKIEKWSDIRAGDVWMGNTVEVVGSAVCFAQDDVRSPQHADVLIAAGNNWVLRPSPPQEQGGLVARDTLWRAARAILDYRDSLVGGDGPDTSGEALRGFVCKQYALWDDLRAVLLAPTVTRHTWACGCVSCICEDEERCHGCGSKACGKPDCQRVITVAVPRVDALNEIKELALKGAENYPGAHRAFCDIDDVVNREKGALTKEPAKPDERKETATDSFEFDEHGRVIQCVDTGEPAPDSPVDVGEDGLILVERLRSLSEAYPEDVFPPLSQDEIMAIHRAHSGFVDRLSAMSRRDLSRIFSDAADLIESLTKQIEGHEGAWCDLLKNEDADVERDPDEVGIELPVIYPSTFPLAYEKIARLKANGGTA